MMSPGVHGTALVNAVLSGQTGGAALRQGEFPSTQGPGSTWWQRFCFTTAGWFACLLKGGGRRQGALIRQAMVEAYDDLSARTFVEDRNPWGMFAGSLSSRRKSQRWVPEENGYRAVYGGYLAAWLDRLEWDQKMGVDYKSIPDGDGYVRTYIDRVQLSGWFGQANGAHIYKPWYTDAVVGKKLGLDLLGLRSSILKLPWWLVPLVVLGLTATVCLVIYRKLKRRK